MIDTYLIIADIFDTYLIVADICLNIYHIFAQQHLPYELVLMSGMEELVCD